MKTLIISLLLFFTVNAQFNDSTDAPITTLIVSEGLVIEGLGGATYARIMHKTVANPYPFNGEFRVGALGTWYTWEDSANVDNGDTVYLRTTTMGKSTRNDVYFGTGYHPAPDFYDVWHVSTVENITPSVHYVDVDAEGTGTGEDWTNAYNNILDDIDWDADIEGGDTIYVSGGADSSLYPRQKTPVGQNANPVNFTKQVVVCPSWEANHNGDVWFYSEDTSSTEYTRLFNITYISNVQFRDFTFFSNPPRYKPLYVSGGVSTQYDSLIVFRNCTIKTNGSGKMMNFSYFAKMTVDSCYFDIMDNPYPNDIDPLGWLYGRGGNTITNNRFIYRNSYVNTSGTANEAVTATSTYLRDTRFNTTLPALVANYHQFATLNVDDSTAVHIDSNDVNTLYTTWIYGTPANGLAYTVTDGHRDFIQMNTYGYLNDAYPDEKLTTTIANNIFVYTKPYATEVNAAGLYTSNLAGDQNIYIYNNIFASSAKSSSSPIYFYNNLTDDNTSVYVLNNTIISYAISCGVSFTGTNDFVSKNNLFLVDTTCSYNFYGLADNTLEVDYNIYGEGGGFTDDFTLHPVTSAALSWAEWVALSGSIYDQNSLTMDTDDVVFVDKYGENISDYVTTTGRDLGVDLSVEYPFLATDILGNARTGSWDMGALQFNGDKWLRSSNGRRIFSSDGKAIIMADE